MPDNNKKKRRSRREHLNDFKVGAGGEYVYTGAIYRFTAEKRKPYLRKLIFGTLICFLASLTQGVLPPAAGMNGCFYVLIPWILELSFSVSVLWAVIRAVYAGNDIKKYLYEATFDTLPFRTTSAAVGAALGIATVTLYLILNGFEGKLLLSLLLLVLKLVTILSALFVKRLSKSAPIEK